MASTLYSSSLQQVNSTINKAQDFFESDAVQTINFAGSIAKSIDNQIPDDSKGPDKISKLALKNVLETLKNFFNELFFGKKQKNKNKKPNRPTDIGILKLLSLLSNIDLCAISSSALSQITLESFNPNPNPIPTDPKWKIQKLAYDIKTIIDSYYVVYGSTINSESKQGLNNLVSTLIRELEKLISNEYLSDPQIQKAYPTSKIASNTIQEFISYIAKTTPNFSFANTNEINKINDKILLVKTACEIIIGLQSPENITKLSDKLIGTNFTQSLSELDKILTPKDNIIKVLKDANERILVIQRIGTIILNTVNLMQIIITILKVVIKVLKIIAQFFGILPIPNIYTTAGITTTVAKGERNISDKITQFVKTLSSINDTLKIISVHTTAFISLIDLIIPKLIMIINKLESCDRKDTNPAQQSLLSDLNFAVKQLEQTKQELNKFIINYQTKQENQINSYGGYTIQILTEEIADQNVQKNTIPRRFGVALDNNNQVVVESTPTFASDDNIIRQEVKLLLSSKGLIKQQSNIFDQETLDVLNEASNWLYDDTVSVDDIPVDTNFNLDPPNNEDENSGLGLNAFVNNLKGGKKLRERMKKIMSEQKLKLDSDLQKAKK